MDVLDGVRLAGPLAPYAEGFAGELARLGFTALSARDQLRLAAHLSRWLAGPGLGTADLTAPVVAELLAARRAAGYTAYRTPKALAPLLAYLRGLGVAPPQKAIAPAAAAEVLAERFRGYLLAERGLQPQVASGYLARVRPFIAGCLREDGQPVGLAQLTAAEVTGFMVGQARALEPKSAQMLATALRSLDELAPESLGESSLSGAIHAGLCLSDALADVERRFQQLIDAVDDFSLLSGRRNRNWKLSTDFKRQVVLTSRCFCAACEMRQ